jgi:peptidoglycan biosynthesis protein MviN/MurJ (putative lipid II flippase)
LALATSIAAISNAGILFYLLRQRLGPIRGRAIVSFIFRISVTAVVMGLSCWLSLYFLRDKFPGRELGDRIVLVVVPMVVGLVTLTIGIMVLRITEARSLFKSLKRNK